MIFGAGAGCGGEAGAKERTSMSQGGLRAMLVVAMFFWGLSWPSSKILIDYAPTEVLALYRYVFATIASFFVLKFLKIPLRISRQFWPPLLIAGVLNALYVFIFFIALAHGTAGKGGVLVTTMIPVFSYLFLILSLLWARRRVSQKLGRVELFGLGVGVASGLCLLDLGSLEELFGRFNMLFLLCAFLWALLTLFTHKVRANALAIGFYVNLISAVLYLPALALPHSLLVLESDYKFWANLFIVAVLSTSLSTSIYYYAIHILGNAKANSFVLIAPASALVGSYFFLGEIPTALTLTGAALSVVAIYFMNKGRRG